MSRTLPQLESHLEDAMQQLSIVQKRQITWLDVATLHQFKYLEPGEEQLLITSTVFKYDVVRQRIYKLSRENRIQAQIEFWLTKQNLEKDDFLQKQLKNHGGWIPISVFLGFNRFSSQSIQEHEIVNSLEKSCLVRLDDTKKYVKPLSIVEQLSRIFDSIIESPESEFHYIVKDLKENGVLTIQKLLQIPQVRDVTTKAEDIIQAIGLTKNLKLTKTQTIKFAHMPITPSSNNNNNNPVTPPAQTIPPSPQQQVHGLSKERAIILCRRYLSECFLLHPRSPTQASVASRIFLAATYPQRASLRVPDIHKLLLDLDPVFASFSVQDVHYLIENSNVNLKVVNNIIHRTKPVIPSRLIRTLEAPTNQCFSVMTYNVLADIMCTKEEFPNVDETLLNWEDFRLPSIYKQLQYYSPDILMLQETQVCQDSNQNLWDKHWKPFLTSHGYFHFASEKKASRPTLNVALAWKINQFEYLERKWIKIAEILGSYENTSTGLVEELAGCAHVLVYAILKHKVTQQFVLIASTHLSSNPATPHIQTAQAQLCLKHRTPRNRISC